MNNNWLFLKGLQKYMKFRNGKKKSPAEKGQKIG